MDKVFRYIYHKIRRMFITSGTTLEFLIALLTWRPRLVSITYAGPTVKTWFWWIPIDKIRQDVAIYEPLFEASTIMGTQSSEYVPDYPICLMII